jgi:hypothetical protein
MMKRNETLPSRLVALACAGCSAVIFAGTGAMLAQIPTPSGSAEPSLTFRAGTQEVLIDAVVTDRKSNFDETSPDRISKSSKTARSRKSLASYWGARAGRASTSSL